MFTKVKIDKEKNSLEAEMPISLNCHERIALLNAITMMTPTWYERVIKICTKGSGACMIDAIDRLADKLMRDTCSYWDDLPFDESEIRKHVCNDDAYKRGLVTAAIANIILLEEKENAGRDQSL